MDKYSELLQQQKRLKKVLSTLDKKASFDTEEGRVYAHYLAKAVVVGLNLEKLDKEKVAQ